MYFRLRNSLQTRAIDYVFLQRVLRFCPYTEVQKTFCDKLEATSVKGIIDKLEFNKINTYCSSEDYVRRMRSQVTD